MWKSIAALFRLIIFLNHGLDCQAYWIVEDCVTDCWYSSSLPTPIGEGSYCRCGKGKGKDTGEMAQKYGARTRQDKYSCNAGRPEKRIYLRGALLQYEGNDMICDSFVWSTGQRAYTLVGGLDSFGSRYKDMFNCKTKCKNDNTNSNNQYNFYGLTGSWNNNVGKLTCRCKKVGRSFSHNVKDCINYMEKYLPRLYNYSEPYEYIQPVFQPIKVENNRGPIYPEKKTEKEEDEIVEKLEGTDPQTVLIMLVLSMFIGIVICVIYSVVTVKDKKQQIARLRTKVKSAARKLRQKRKKKVSKLRKVQMVDDGAKKDNQSVTIFVNQ